MYVYELVTESVFQGGINETPCQVMLTMAVMI